MRKLIESGVDPIEQRNAARASAERAAKTVTFYEAARATYEALKPGWKNEKHTSQWINTLEAHVFPCIGELAIDMITPKECADVLRPIWLEKPETASRIKQRMHAVMQWAWANGLISANPVSVVHLLLPKQPPARGHQPAMPWRQIPKFICENLVERLPADSTRAALEFAILTAARSGEVRAASWDEFDMVERVWNVPAERMKTGIVHRVPLSDRACEIIKSQSRGLVHDSLVFPSPRGKVLSDMTLTALLRRLKAPSDMTARFATAHGFRSSFRDWASENGYSRDLAERALSHTVQSRVEAAYHRTDLLEQRRPMMQAWATLLSTGQ